MEPMAAATPSSMTMQPCQSCKNMRMTQLVRFNRNTGMLVARRTTSRAGHFCKSCIRSIFWEFEFKNLILGPWGMISLVVTPIYMIQNAVTYASALHKLRGALE